MCDVLLHDKGAVWPCMTSDWVYDHSSQDEAPAAAKKKPAATATATADKDKDSKSKEKSSSSKDKDKDKDKEKSSKKAPAAPVSRAVYTILCNSSTMRINRDMSANNAWDHNVPCDSSSCNLSVYVVTLSC